MTPRFGALFYRFILRTAVRQPLLPILNILSISVGVAVFLAIQMANTGALSSFKNAVGLVAGTAHLEVRGDFSEALFPAVQAAKGVVSATPLVEGIVTLPDQPGEYLRVLGVDPFTGESMRVFRIATPNGGDFDAEGWLSDPQAIAVSKEIANRGALTVLSDGATFTLQPRFILEATDAAVSSEPRIAAMDIGWAQELLGKRGRLTSIQVQVEDPLRAQEVASAIKQVVPHDVFVGSPARRGAEVENMLAAFQLNLTALSLVSMVVGIFLIYNSLSATVVRRRVEIGILRASGATKLEVAALFLAEAIFCGLLGSFLGIVLAVPLAQALAAPVSQTVSTLYTLVTLDRVSLTGAQIGVAFFVGIGASLLAAWRPSAEASSCDPASVLHRGSVMDSFQMRTRSWGLWGLAALVAAGGSSWWAWQGGGRFMGFASVALLVAGVTLLVPITVQGSMRLFDRAHWIVRLAAQQLVRALHRNTVTIAALAVAVAMTVSVSVMVYSFRASVMKWLETTLVADLFIAPAANEIIGLQSFLPPQTVEWARADSRISDAGTFRELTVLCDNTSVSLAVLEGGGRGPFAYLTSLPNAAALFHQPGYLVASESFANRHGTRAGDHLELASPAGPQTFIVAGIIKDFTRDSGLLLMDRRNFRKAWSDERIHSLALTVHDPAEVATIAEDFRASFASAGAFAIYTNSDLRKRVVEIFDQTFAVTSILRSIAVIVAVAGVFLSLTTLVLEREREVGVLRSQGASPGQVRTLVFVEAGLVGLMASVIGVIAGAFMAMILTWVINKAFFGWTIDLRYPWSVLLLTPFWMIPAAVLAAWGPAARAAKISPAVALRSE